MSYENLLTPTQLSEYLPDKPTVGTISVWKSMGRIPFKKFGRKVFYDKNEIDTWNNEGRPKSISK